MAIFCSLPTRESSSMTTPILVALLPLAAAVDDPEDINTRKKIDTRINKQKNLEALPRHWQHIFNYSLFHSILIHGSNNKNVYHNISMHGSTWLSSEETREPRE